MPFPVARGGARYGLVTMIGHGEAARTNSKRAYPLPGQRMPLEPHPRAVAERRIRNGPGRHEFISITGGLLAIQDPGVTQAVSGNVSITGSGSLQLDGNNIGGAGGSSMTITGTLTNSSSNGNALSIGTGNITSADTLTVNGSGGLTNTGQIDIEGSATVQATLNVADAAAGFGTAGTETGNVYLQGDALLEFKSGEISTVDGAIQLNGANARIADAGSTSSNSALTGLTTVAGNFWLQNGATVSPTDDVSITGSGSLQLDGNNIGGAGGSSMTIGGTLTNSSSNGNALSIGTGNITSADTITVRHAGSPTPGQSTCGRRAPCKRRSTSPSRAGFGTAGVLSGNVNLSGGKVLLEFASGEITTIAANSELSIAGTTAFLADATGLTSNSALTGLSTITGQLFLYDGASVSTSKKDAAKGDLTVTGLVDLDQFNADGGSQLSVSGTLTNSGTIERRPQQQHAVGGRHDHGGRALQHRDHQPVGQRDRASDAPRLRAGRVRHGGRAERKRQSERRQSVARIRQRRDHDHRGEQRTVDRRHDGVPGRRVRSDEQQRADWAFDDHGPAFSL